MAHGRAAIHKSTRRAEMARFTKDGFGQLKRNVQQDGNDGQCPIWSASMAKRVRAGGSHPPTIYVSPRGGGLFEVPFACDNFSLNDDTRKRISSWIWERNAAFEALGTDETAELPELTPERIKEIANRQPLTVEQRIDRALQAVGKPPNSMFSRNTFKVGDPEGYIAPQMLFEAATECDGSAGEMDWLLQELEQSGFVRLPDSLSHGLQCKLHGQSTVNGLRECFALYPDEDRPACQPRSALHSMFQVIKRQWRTADLRQWCSSLHEIAYTAFGMLAPQPLEGSVKMHAITRSQNRQRSGDK